jgi:glutaredoxin-like protein
MSLISAPDQARLRGDFAALQREVRLLFFTQTIGCETCRQARQILDELPGLSDRIVVDEVNVVLERERAARYAVDRVPAVALVSTNAEGHEQDSHIRFLGTPSGYEFISLIRAILLVGGGPSSLSGTNRARVAAIDAPVTLHVFTTPTCPHCPRAVILAHEIAYANPNVTAYAVEATEFPDLARRYQVTGVPKTVIADRAEILGAVPEDAFIEQTLAACQPGQAPTALSSSSE